MKARTKAENAAYAKAQREKKRLAAVSPARVSPRITSTVSPTPPISGVCPNCEAQAAEITRLGDLVRTLLAKVATLEADQGDITGSKTTSRTMAHHATPKGEDAEALRQRVIAAKVDRINNYGRNPVIGKATL